jgi:hypothetical protein
MFDRSRLWAIGLLVASFAAGVAVGGVASAAFGDRGREHGRGPGSSAASFLDRLDRDLHLRPAQRDSVDGILKRYDEPMRHIGMDARQRFDSLRLQVRGEIDQVLDQRQRVRYQVFNQRNDSVRAAREHGGLPRDRSQD